MARKTKSLAVAVILGIAVLTIYLSLPSANYNGDGLGYARIVENADTARLFSVSARLLFCPAGRLAHTLVHLVGVHVRSVRTLEIMNSVFGAIGVSLFFLTVYSVTRRTRLSILASLGLGFSLSFWYWSTNATSYPGNILFSILTLYLLVRLTQVTATRSYFLICTLIGLTHALACLFWLSALLLGPAVALGVAIAGRWTSLADRIKASFIYCASFGLFFLTPLLSAGFATARLETVTDFPGWLTAASYGIPPRVSLLNASRGVIGFSSSILRTTDLGPAVKQALWGVPYAGRSGAGLYVEIAAFLLLWLLMAAAAIYFFRYRKAVLTLSPRLAVILLLWSLLPAAFGLIWLGSDTERWLSITPVIWLALVFIAVHALRYLRRSRAAAVEVALWTFAAVVFAYNLAFSVIPDHNPENNRYMKAARFFSSHLSKGDMVLVWGHDHVFTADYLLYFFDIDALHLGRISREQPDEAFSLLESRIRDRLKKGSKVLVNGRIFLDSDLPDSHRSDDDANIRRTEFARFFGSWSRREAFRYLNDTFWWLEEK